MKKLIATIALLASAGCAQHDTKPAFQSSLRIADRGISIPLPPPSLLEEPNQAVDIEGEVVGDDRLSTAATAHVVDLQGGEEVTVDVAAGADSFVAQGLPVDLTDNCLELWLQTDDAESEHAFYSATVAADGETIVVTPDCE